ncbi:MAG TPA: hypothetical protein VLE89_00860 [Chlamydiales bacterium]|nr:hypothetical protein [Chlamydiales bacterium]
MKSENVGAPPPHPKKQSGEAPAAPIKPHAHESKQIPFSQQPETSAKHKQPDVLTQPPSLKQQVSTLGEAGASPDLGARGAEPPTGGAGGGAPDVFRSHNSDFRFSSGGAGGAAPDNSGQRGAKPPIPGVPENASFLGWGWFNSLFSKIAPELPVIAEIPSDANAKKISTRWKTKNQSSPISLLSFQEPAAQKTLLEEVAKALDVYFGGARLVQAEGIEKEKQWEAFLSTAGLKIVIVCDYTLWQLNGLMAFYKENPTQGIRTLGGISLFLLPDLSLYLKDPLLKRSLWKALCQKLSS